MTEDFGRMTRDAIARLVIEKEQLVQANASLAAENEELRTQLAAASAPVKA